MDFDPAHARVPLRPFDPESSTTARGRKDHKRRRSRTTGTTFVSTAIVPAQSSADVLSSLINSLTLLSGSARGQTQIARELDTPGVQQHQRIGYTELGPPFELQQKTITDTAVGHEIDDFSDGDEAEPPVVGYSRARSKERKRPSLKERWAIHGSGKEKSVDLGRRPSSNTLRRPQSSASSTMGIPSIERGNTGSSSSLAMAPTPGTKSPLTILFSSRADNESIHSTHHLPRNASVQSTRSFRTVISKHSTKASQDQGKENIAPIPSLPLEHQSPTQTRMKLSSEHKTYSPLSPANRDDLGEHLIPSRHSSIRHSPTLKRSNKGGQTSIGRSLSLHSNSAAPGTEMVSSLVNEENLEEEDSTLKRIRELQKAKEQRQLEWRNESKKSDRPGKRHLRHRSKSREQVSTDDTTPPVPEVIPKIYQDNPIFVSILDKADNETNSMPVVHEIDVPSPSLRNVGALSPALSTSHKHRRSFSGGLRRSDSLKARPVDYLRSVSEQVEAYVTAPRLTQRIRHPRTGRTIAFSEVGDPNGFVVFCCVGMGLTRYVSLFYDDIARTQKLRLITPDRPGIGETSPFSDNVCKPLAWVDDVAIICQTLNIDRFSLLAHSAGSIFALATALKMPQMVRGRIHLLAPWIPPSQFPSGSARGDVKAINLPMAHKLLSILPAPFLRAANSRLLSAASASLEPRSKSRKKDTYEVLIAEMAADMQSGALAKGGLTAKANSSLSHLATTPSSTPPPYTNNQYATSLPTSPSPSAAKRQFSASATRLRSPTPNEAPTSLTPQARQALLDSELAKRLWNLATLNSNPSVDLLVCLERHRPVGFRYTDVTRGVVIHHGRKDLRVPISNAEWLSREMKRCELRILENEGHGLLSSADTMSKVIAEIGQEWEEWYAVVQSHDQGQGTQEVQQDRIAEIERRRFFREGF